MKSEILRKIFHLTSLVYVLGFYLLERRPLLLLLGIWLVIEFSFELIRLRSAKLKAFFNQQMSFIMRNKEKTGVTGTFWMALGVFMTAILAGSQMLGMVSVLYLVFGDAVASLAGKGIGGARWPGSSKRLSGSAACFLVCALIGFLTPLRDFGTLPVFVGAATATVIELIDFKVDDNFSIPVFSILALNLVTGAPFFGGV